MTMELIAIKAQTIGEGLVKTVDPRELHAFLEVKTAFKDWVVRRIADYSFVEERDFGSFLSRSPKGQETKEYALSLDMAKQLSMVERNAKGKQARLYFIECERVAKAAPRGDLSVGDDVHARLDNLESRLQLLAPRAEALLRLQSGEGSLGLREASKILGLPEKKLIQTLISIGWLYRKPDGGLLGYSEKTKAGLIDHSYFEARRADGSIKTIATPNITPKGLAQLAGMFDASKGEFFQISENEPTGGEP